MTGPVGFAIDGKDETAWGIDVGPGRRNQPRKAVFTAEKPIAFPGGTILTFHLTQNHGGWNSDDNQNHNLGRFRLSITSAPDAVGRPAAASGPRDPGHPPREADAGPGRRRLQLLADDGARSGRRPTTGSRRCGGSIPRARRNWCSAEREQPRPTHVLQRGDFLKPVKPVEPGVPAFLNPLPAGVAADPADLRPMAGRPRGADDGAGDRQPGLAGLFRHRDRRTSEDLGMQCEPPVASRAARLAGRRVHGQRLEPQAPAPADRRPRRPIASRRGRPPSCWPATRTTACWPAARGSGSTPRSSATSPWPPAGCSNPKIGGPSVFPPAPAFLFQPPASYGPKVWNEATGPDRYRRALYTFRYRSVPYPMLQTFDAPNGDFACVRRTRSNTPLQALTTLNEPIFLECARALALRTLREGGSTDADRLTYAFRRCLARPPTEAETATLLDLLAAPDPAVREARRRSLGAGRRRPEEAAAAARRRDAGPARRLDGRGARAAEPR